MAPQLVHRFSRHKLMVLLLIVGHAGASQLPSESAEHAGSARERFVRLLFGDHQWKLGQYCDAHYESHMLLTNDAQIESLHNGSYLDSIDGTDDWSRVLEQLDGASRVGLRSRQTLGIVCSFNTWDYAHPQEEMQSNAPHESESDCQEQLYGLFAFAETLANKTGATHQKCHHQQEACENWTSSRPNNHSRESTFNLHHWNQYHSFGRLSSGPPYKESLLLGDFDACARLNSTRYCLGSFGPHGGGTERALYRIGLCLPRACSSGFFKRSQHIMRVLDVLVKRNLPEIVQGRDRNQLTEVFCPPAADSDYKRLWAKDNLAKVLLYVLPSFWILLLIYGTFFHTITRVKSSQECDKIISSFSLCSNWRKFTDAQDLDPKLAGLNSLKILAMNWLMISHISMTIIPYVKNLNELNSYYPNSLQGPIILQGQHSVSLFFIMSGIIFGTKYLRKKGPEEEVPEISFRRAILWRYFRLAPMYLFAYAYIKKFSHLVGDGPLWDSGVSSQSELRQCLVESWTVPLLMLANFTPPYAHCLITGWYIANDFQIYLVLPFLVIAYRRSRVHGTLVVLATFALTHLSHAWFWASEEYDFNRLARDSFHFGSRLILDRLVLDYVNPLGRLGTYFMGVLVADLLLARDLDQQTQTNELHMLEVYAPGQLKQTTFIEPLYRQQTTTRERVNVSLAEKEDHQCMNDKSRESVTAPSTATSVGRPTDKDQNHGSLLVTFKDTCLLALAALLTVLVLFSVVLSVDKITFLGAYKSTIVYPLCRISIELSCSIFVYYLLRTNQKGRGAGKARARSGRADSSSSPLSLKATTRETTDETTATKTREKLTPASGEENNKDDEDEDENEDDGNQRQLFLIRLLKLPTWNILVKLNYGLMLLHYTFIRVILQQQRELFLFTWTNFFQFVALILMASYLFAFLVHLTIEMPLSALTRLFVSRVLLAGKGGGKSSK